MPADPIFRPAPDPAGASPYPAAHGSIRTTPILVGGTLLVVAVAAAVIHRMAAMDAELAQSRNAAAERVPAIVVATSASHAEAPVTADAPAPPPTPATDLPSEPPAPESAAAPAPVSALSPAPAPVSAPAAVAQAEPPRAESPELATVEAPPPAPTRASAPIPRPPPAAPAPPPTAWWPAPIPDALNLLHAGYLGDYPALLLLFDGDFQSTDGLDRAITVTRADGSKVEGTWRIGPNGRALILPVPPGTYRVDVADTLLDVKGRSIAAPVGGPVVVH